MNHPTGTRLSFFDEWTNQARDDASAGRPERGRHIWGRRITAVGALAVAGVAASVVLPGSTATADPSANDWYRLRMCESSNNYSINTGNDHYGAYQFDLSTWRSVGGSGYPNQASRGEQDARALILYRERGWQPWQCAGIVGLREDADARSGRISDIHVPGNGSGSGGGSSSGPPPSPPRSSHGVPAFPGSRSYVFGDNNSTIKAFQNRMHARGFFPPGTGQYGPKTLAMVKRLQLLNGLRGSGLLGPKTWRAAWVGRYWLPRHVDTDVPSAPAFPASRPFVYGDNSLVIKRFQDQMHARGFFPVGTGQYGPNTLAMVKRLQLLNGLHGTGLLGPKTWHAAWAGRYWLPTRASATSVPPFPASRSLVYGERNLMIKRFQDQMHARGFFPVGTGQYGPNTLAMVKRLQLQNGLHGSGLIGPETWRAAWLGRYQLP